MITRARGGRNGKKERDGDGGNIYISTDATEANGERSRNRKNEMFIN